MKLLSHNWKTSVAKVLVETLDDLWYLHTLIEPGDRVEGHSTRKIKVGDAETGTAVRKHVFVALTVERVEFAEFSTHLRLLGKVIEGSEEVPRGTHHALTVEVRDTLTIIKPWAQYQIERLREACSQGTPEVLICILDRDQATIAALKRSGYQVLTTLTGEVQRKYDPKIAGKDFYAEVQRALVEYNSRMPLTAIIVASPAFWKEEFAKTVRDPELKKKLILATVSSSDPSALREVLTRPEVQHALAKDRISKEQELVEQLMAEIAKDGLVTYGKAKVAIAVNSGAVATLLVSEGLILRSRQEGTFAPVDRVMRMAADAGGSVRIIAIDHDGGKRLDGLGGIAATLRYRIVEL